MLTALCSSCGLQALRWEAAADQDGEEAEAGTGGGTTTAADTGGGTGTLLRPGAGTTCRHRTRG